VKRITCLMLDMGGVLTQEQRIDKVDVLMRKLGLDCAREVFLEAYYAERLAYDRGGVDGAEYWQRVARALGARLRESEVPTLVRTDLESWFNAREGMLEFLVGLRGMVGRLVLLSNIHFDGARYLREGEGRAWVARFDALVLSCEHGLLKPEREIYELALAAAGALPAETLFVDDNQANVEGARAAGLSSFRFTDLGDFASRMSAEYELAR
jgi:putative hydrolase of the HAD superfamily